MDISNTVPLHQPERRRTDLLQTYQLLGLNVSFHGNVHLFGKLSNGREPLMSIKQTPRRRLPRINLKYPSFRINLPKFASEADKEMFLQVQEYRDVLNNTCDSKTLRGHIELIYNSSANQEYDCGWPTNISRWRSPSRRHLSEFVKTHVVVPLLVPDSDAFQHVIDGVLPKLAQIAPFLSSHRLRYLVHAPRDDNILELYTKLSIKPYQLLYWERLVDTFYYSEIPLRYQLNTCITPPIHPILWQKMRRLLNIKEHLGIAYSEAVVVLLTRIHSFNGGRSMLNRFQVMDMLRRRYPGQVVVYDGDLNLKKSIHLFSRARIIIGVHGGALYNFIFSPKESVIIEYISMDRFLQTVPKGISHTIFWKMAKMIGQPFYRVFEDPQNDMGDIEINLAKLELVLNEVDKEQSFIT